MNEDQEYLALRDIFLEANPACVQCGKTPANQIHHICRGVNRRRSLLNSDTWLGVCSTACHEALAALPVAVQVTIKQRSVKGTVERLRK